MTLDEAIEMVDKLIEYCNLIGHAGQRIRLYRIRNYFIDMRDRANESKGA